MIEPHTAYTIYALQFLSDRFNGYAYGRRMEPRVYSTGALLFPFVCSHCRTPKMCLLFVNCYLVAQRSLDIS